MNKLLSIIVPIKNSYEYLNSIIKKVSELDEKYVELVINDNSTNNNDILEILKKTEAKNIVYNYNSNEISMSQNFEDGINMAKGKYICILGADDNISSSIINVVKYLNKHNIESAVFRKAHYYWPGMQFKAHPNRPCLTIYRSNKLINKIDVQSEFKSVMKNGCVSIGKLPEPYHGIVKKECLEKVKKISGKYIPGSCPDMVMAMTLSQIVTNHIFIDAPIAISGQSYNSAGGKGARGQHKGDLKNKSFLPSNIEENWPSFIPKLWTGPTIYADAMYNSLKNMKKEHLIKYFNKEANYTNLYVFFPEYRYLIKEYNNNFYSRIKIVIYSICLITLRIIKYIQNWIVAKFKLSLHSIYHNIKDSYEASKIIDFYITSKIEKKFSKKFDNDNYNDY